MRRNRWLFSLLTALVLTFAFCGCSPSEFDLVPVSGLVTLDGEPVANARVIFSPQRTGEAALVAGPSSDGMTDDSGRYDLLTSVEGHKGAVVGAHTVTISTFVGKSDRATETHTVVQKELIPTRYQEPGALTIDVPSGGTESADFELTKKRKR